MDATAGIAIGQRRGLGHVRHVDVAFLWVQQVVERGRHTAEMLADALAKPVTALRMDDMLGKMGYSFRDDQHALALRAG